MPRIYPRGSYLAKLRPFYDSDIIKVITGIRRCGKSCLLLTVMDSMELGIGLEEVDASGPMVTKAVKNGKTQTNTALTSQNELKYETVRLPRKILRERGIIVRESSDKKGIWKVTQKGLDG